LIEKVGKRLPGGKDAYSMPTYFISIFPQSRIQHGLKKKSTGKKKKKQDKQRSLPCQLGSSKVAEEVRRARYPGPTNKGVASRVLAPNLYNLVKRKNIDQSAMNYRIMLRSDCCREK